MAEGDPIPPEDHVARYCKPSTVQDGVIGSTAFEIQPGDDHLSVNWLEHFVAGDFGERLERVRDAFAEKGYALRPNGRFAVLNVEALIEKVKLRDVRVLHWPDGGDQSHSGIFNYSSDDLQVALDLQSLLMPGEVFPAVI